MPITRRHLLAAAWRGSAAAAVIGSGALGWRLFETGLVDGAAPAFDAWTSYDDLPGGDPASLVGAAILAASPHNTQPWRFAIGAGRIDVLADEERHLGSFDPYRREMWLGLGCAVENMVQAAGAKGFAIESVTAVPGGAGSSAAAGGPAARVVFEPGATAPSRLAAVITSRRTHRSGYLRDVPIAADVIARLEALPSSADTRLLLFRGDEPGGRAFAQGTVAATQAIADDATMSGDSLRWFRANPRAVRQHRDGLSIPAAGLEPWLATMGQLMPAPSAREADAYWVESTRHQVDTAAWFGMVLVRSLHDRRQQIEAGRLWQRAQLELTLAGIASQPLNQMIERVDREKQLGRADAMARRLAAWSGDRWLATFAFRFGIAARQVPHSARRDIRQTLDASA